MKRKTATAAELQACKRKFWEESALFALQRARRRVRAGEPPERRDRDYIADRLDDLFYHERSRVHAMQHKRPTRFLAYLADYMQTELRIDLDQACAAVAGDLKADSIRKAVDRLREERRRHGKRGRARR